MTSAWIRSQDRKRNLIATASTVSLYALAFLGVWLVGLLAPATLASMPSTIVVDLGGAEGPPGEVPQGLENAPDRPADAPPGAAPLPAAGNEAAALQNAPSASSVAPIPAPVPAKVPAAPAKTLANTPPVKAKAPPAKAAVAPASSKTVPDKASVAAAAQAAAAATAAAQAQAAQEEAALRAAAATAQATAGPPKTRTFGSSSGSGAPVSSSGTGSSPGVAGGTGTVTFRGSEMGNALTTTFGASSGQVGRNIYVPIYLYMPLPSTIDDSIYRNVQYKETFRSYYQASGSQWLLNTTNPVPIAQRGDIWTMLEAAGYDASNADYKKERKLSPVVLEFTVDPPLTKDKKTKVDLVDVRLVSSSGSSEIDEAVIYGFRQGAFFNMTGNAISGRFVYGF